MQACCKDDERCIGKAAGFAERVKFLSGALNFSSLSVQICTRGPREFVAIYFWRKRLNEFIRIQITDDKIFTHISPRSRIAVVGFEK